MKSIIIISLILTGTLFAKAQDTSQSVPPDVLDAMSMLYPETKDVEWSRKGTDYMACFSHDEMDHSLLFDKIGMLKEVRREIKEAELPDVASALVAEKYTRWTITKVTYVTLTGIHEYEVVLKNNQEKVLLTFDASGSLRKVATM